MSFLKKLSLCLVAIFCMALLPTFLSAQDNMAQNNNMAKSVSATGCLKQGTDHGGYYLMGENGTMYELWGHNLAEHVNHKVTVTGMEEHMPQSMEQKRESSEMSEAGGASHVDMKVTSIKMVSESCQ